MSDFPLKKFDNDVVGDGTATDLVRSREVVLGNSGTFWTEIRLRKDLNPDFLAGTSGELQAPVDRENIEMSVCRRAHAGGIEETSDSVNIKLPPETEISWVIHKER